MNKKIDTLTKVKLIYSIELWVISAIFLVLGILRLTKVISPNNTLTMVFTILTLAGGLWIIADFCWGFFSKTRRNRICLLDKILNLPVGIFFIVIDILFLCNVLTQDGEARMILIPCAFIYIALDYTFQGIYHYKYPLPELIKEAEEADRQEQEEKLKKEQEIKEDENKGSEQ